MTEEDARSVSANVRKGWKADDNAAFLRPAYGASTTLIGMPSFSRWGRSFVASPTTTQTNPLGSTAARIAVSYALLRLKRSCGSQELCHPAASRLPDLYA